MWHGGAGPPQPSNGPNPGATGPADRAPPRGRSPIGDQTELRWRIGCEIALIRTEYCYGLSAVCWRRAATELLPWLEHTHARLDTSRPVPELDHLVQDWRSRRVECLPAGHDYHDWAELILVDHVARPDPSPWWRLRNGDQPPPPR